MESFRNRDARAHVGCYAPVVETYFGKHNVANEQLRRYKERAFSRIATVRQFDISDVNISADSSEHYRATFRKKWDTPTTGGKTFAGEEIERLTFMKFGADWKITSEEELQVLHLVKG